MSVVKANTYLAASGSPTEEPSIPALDQRMAKAWCNFTGNNTVTIRKSFNISSLVDNGAGDYSLNFINPISSDGSYSTGVASAERGDIYSTFAATVYQSNSTTARIWTWHSSNTRYDGRSCSFAAFSN